MITMEALLPLARDVELRLAALYRDLAAHFVGDLEMETFFLGMAREEEAHAAWVEAMFEAVPAAHGFQTLVSEDFSNLLSGIEDIHDEVREERIGLRDALEILLHMESSMAESFYEAVPEDTPGLSRDIRARMIAACRRHAGDVASLRDRHAGVLPGIRGDDATGHPGEKGN